jgi:hypothetical protein
MPSVLPRRLSRTSPGPATNWALRSGIRTASAARPSGSKRKSRRSSAPRRRPYLSHLLVHEQDGPRVLHDLEFSFLTRGFETPAAKHLEAIPGRIGAVLAELPLRDAGCLLPAWDDLAGFSAACRARGVASTVGATKDLGGNIDKSIPRSTQAVYVELLGSQASDFLADYQSYGLAGKVPLLRPGGEGAAARDHDHDRPVGAAEREAPGGRGHLHGLPVTISHTTYSPVQDTYICKVENVGGTLRNAPVTTYPSVPPWGYLSQSAWLSDFTTGNANRQPWG